MPTVEETKPVPKIRKSIVIFLAVFFVLFGLPLYYLTTTVYRADLPKEQIEYLSNTLIQKTKFELPIYVQIPKNNENFISKCQELVYNKLDNFHYGLTDFWSLKLVELGPSITNEDYILKLNFEGNDEHESLHLSSYDRNIVINIDSNTRDIEQYIVDVLLDQVFVDEIKEAIKIINKNDISNKKEVALSYSPQYNIVISLVVEGGHVIDWEIDKTIALLNPIIDELKHYSNLSISSQIHYYSQLAIQPELSSDNKTLIINSADLPSFIDFGNWNLESNSVNPAINFILYYPDTNFKGMTLEIANSVSNSFLVPQWGGVHIFNKNTNTSDNALISKNDLLPAFEIFTSQLFQLLGLPKHPKSPVFRMDTLSRISIYSNLRKSLDNLISLVKVTESLNEISIPDQTSEYVKKALNQIEESLNELQNSQNYKKSVNYSAIALTNSENAFFEKEMVQQAYFPSEHKLAVFLPLLGPMACILSIGLLKVISDWKAQRKHKKD